MSIFTIVTYGLFVVANFVVSIFARATVAGDARIAVHWTFDGTPDRFASANVGLFIIPIASAVAAGVFLGAGQSTNLFPTACGVLFVLLVANWLICLNGIGYTVSVGRWVLIAIAALLILAAVNFTYYR
jgi:uncharacterized membrane protein